MQTQDSADLFWEKKKKGQNGESKMEDPITRKQMQYSLQYVIRQVCIIQICSMNCVKTTVIDTFILMI